MSFKIPKKYKSVARQALDPGNFNILGSTDALVGGVDKTDKSAEQAAQAKALADRQAASDEFTNGGAAQYDKGDILAWQGLSPAQRQAASGLGDITTDPRYKEAEMGALRDLEDQSHNGFTARDRADMAQVEGQANRANRGRLGAIQQNMQARGMSGSGMDLVAQMQSSQDSNEMEALKALEQEGMMQDRKQAATMGLGQMSSQLQGQDFAQAAQKAQAQDAINRFNTQNANDTARYNNTGMNQTAQGNWNRANTTADRNTSANYDYRKDRLGVKQGQATKNYDVGVEGENRKMIQDQQNEDAQSSKFRNALNTASAAYGAFKGTGGQAPATTAAAPNTKMAGSAIEDPYMQKDPYDQATMYASHGGKVPGAASHHGDSPANDTQPAMLSPGEIVVPRSAAADPAKAAKFVADENGQDADVIGALLGAMQSMNKRK